MKALIEKLKKETEALKAEYLEKTQSWAQQQLIRNQQRAAAYHGMKREQIFANKNFYYGEQKFVHNTPQWHFTNEFISRSIKAAEDHYEGAIEKLADRVIKKGMNPKAVKITSAKVGINLETTISDGEQTVRAYTIVASGPVQRPHYRYLVK